MAKSVSRREFAALALACCVPSSLAASKREPEEVILGLQSYSLRDRPLAQAVEAMVKLGVRYCELGNNHMEPAGVSRDELRRWRLSVPLSEFTAVRKVFDEAGILITGYSYPFRSDYTEDEVRRGFEMARALGVGVITSSANVSMTPRMDRYAVEFGVRVGLHNHSNRTRDEVAAPEDFMAGMAGRSRFIGINLDTGHFSAANFDPLGFLKQNHGRIFSVHLKDRKKDQGPKTPFGEGDTPLIEVLRLLKRKRWNIPAMIEYEYKAPDTLAEVRRCLDYCRKALA